MAASVIARVRWYGARGSRKILSLAIAGLILLAVLPHWFHTNWCHDVRRSPVTSDDEAERIFSSLHRNIYRALRAETEDELYDTLARSIDGELLGETYFKMHRLTLARDLATGFQVRRLKPLESMIVDRPADSNGSFRVRHRWRVYGIVSHAGHRHARVNEYEATFSVAKNQHGWRITEVNVHDCYRTTPGLLFAAMKTTRTRQESQPQGRRFPFSIGDREIGESEPSTAS